MPEEVVVPPNGAPPKKEGTTGNQPGFPDLNRADEGKRASVAGDETPVQKRPGTTDGQPDFKSTPAESVVNINIAIYINGKPVMQAGN